MKDWIEVNRLFAVRVPANAAVYYRRVRKSSNETADSFKPDSRPNFGPRLSDCVLKTPSLRQINILLAVPLSGVYRSLQVGFTNMQPPGIEHLKVRSLPIVKMIDVPIAPSLNL